MRESFLVVRLVVLTPAIVGWALTAGLVVTLRTYALLPAIVFGIVPAYEVLPVPGSDLMISLIEGTRK